MNNLIDLLQLRIKIFQKLAYLKDLFPKKINNKRINYFLNFNKYKIYVKKKIIIMYKNRKMQIINLMYIAKK
jgi:hypothetical protein